MSLSFLGQEIQSPPTNVPREKKMPVVRALNRKSPVTLTHGGGFRALGIWDP